MSRNGSIDERLGATFVGLHLGLMGDWITTPDVRAGGLGVGAKRPAKVINELYVRTPPEILVRRTTAVARAHAPAPSLIRFDHEAAVRAPREADGRPLRTKLEIVRLFDPIRDACGR